MPFEHVRIFKETHHLRELASPKRWTINLPRKHRATCVVGDNRESRQTRRCQQKIVESQKTGIDGRRMFDLKQRFYSVGTSGYPYNIDLRQDCGDLFKSVWQFTAYVKPISQRPVQLRYIVVRNPHVVSFAMSYRCEERLYLAMRQFTVFAKAILIETSLQ